MNDRLERAAAQMRAKAAIRATPGNGARITERQMTLVALQYRGQPTPGISDEDELLMARYYADA